VEELDTREGGKIQVADLGQATPSPDRDAIVAVAGDVAEWLQG
jgi:hypothetical protein